MERASYRFRPLRKEETMRPRLVADEAEIWRAPVPRRTTKRKYVRSAGGNVKNEMHRYKRRAAKSGPAGNGGNFKSRRQAIAIGLSKARKKGNKAPAKMAS